MATTKLYANKDGERAQVAFMRLGTANGSDKVVRIQRGMQVLYDDWPQCTISANAEHTTGIAPATLRYGQPWAAALIPDSGYGIDSVEVLMDGTEITQAYQDGIISIPRVTGNVVITVETASVTDATMFTKRTTANGLQVLNNKALLKSIRGNSGQYTQRIPTTISSMSTNYTLTKGDDGVITMSNFTIRSSTADHFRLGASAYGSDGDKIYCGCKAYADTDSEQTYARFGCGLTPQLNNTVGSNYNVQRAKNTWVIVHYIAEYDSSDKKFCLFDVYNAASGAQRWMSENTIVKVKNFRCVNLTRLFGKGNEPTIAEFEKLFPIDDYDYVSSSIISNKATNYISMDGETTLQNVSLNLSTLTGKLNGSGESVIIFPDGLKSSCNEAVNDTYDEIKQVNGVWKAFKRIGTERASSAISGRGEYEILENEEVYVLDNQTLIPELIVADGGTEEILPSVIPTPTSMPAILEIQYGSIPSRGLLGGLLGGTKGGGSDEPDYSDGEEITDYEEEQEPNEDSDEPIVEEPLEEPSDEEPKEDENEEEPKEDIKESPVIDEKQELKK